MKKNILFDLDGTLTNPAEGITNSVAYALKNLGLPIPPRKELESFIGPPLNEHFKSYGLDDETSQKAVNLFREYFADKGIYENFVFEHCAKTLCALKKNGNTLYIATSKPAVFAEHVLERFNLAQYFSLVVGSGLGHIGRPKGEVIAEVLQKSSTHPNEAVMVGDRKFDILGAKENGLVSVGVLFGFGSEQELLAAGADFIAKDFKHLEKILLDEI